MTSEQHISFSNLSVFIDVEILFQTAFGQLLIIEIWLNSRTKQTDDARPAAWTWKFGHTGLALHRQRCCYCLRSPQSKIQTRRTRCQCRSWCHSLIPRPRSSHYPRQSAHQISAAVSQPALIALRCFRSGSCSRLQLHLSLFVCLMKYMQKGKAGRMLSMPRQCYRT